MTPIRPPRELVLASAGAGKTYRISSRLIGLLAHGEEPEHLLASTFTRKAAGEILNRTLLRLAAAAVDADAAADLARAATLDVSWPLPTRPDFWAQLLERTVEGMHRLEIGTLDAFFVRVAGAFEWELGLTPNWRIPDEPTIRALRAEAVLRLIAEGGAAGRPRLIELLRLSARGEARRPIREMLGGTLDNLREISAQLDHTVAEPWRAFPEDVGGRIPTARARADLADEMERLAPPTKVSGRNREYWIKSLRESTAAVRGGLWEGLMEVTLCQRVAAGESSYAQCVIPPDVQEVLGRALDAARAAIRPRLAAQVRALGELTEAYSKAYHREQRERGLFDFTDIARMISDVDPMGERPDVYYRLDARTRHILLDEFQDTSYAQWEALEPLVDEVLSGDDRAAVIVADPKQSIYGWRGGEPELVDAIRARYSLGTDELATSWRSSQVVLDFVNQVFGSIADNPALQGNEVDASTAERWASHFAPHRAERDLPGHVVIEVGPADEGRSSSRPLLCRFAASRVQQLRAAHPGASIGVLMRTNLASARLFLELRQLGVEVSQEGGNPLTDSGACEAVLALLRLADHPGDRIALYHVVNSPVGEAVNLPRTAGPREAAAVSRALRRRLTEDGYGSTLAWVARQVVGLCDAREARRLSQLVELAHRYDDAASLRPADFVRLAEAERIEDPVSTDVRVMTIHQAKGLEFDIVVLPQLDEPIARMDRSIPVVPFRDAPTGPVTAVLPSAGRKIRLLFPELEPASQQQRSGVVRDGLSTLYVALTRARHAIHAVIAPDRSSGPTGGTTSARIIREALKESGVRRLRPAVAGVVLHRFGEAEWSRDPRTQLRTLAADSPSPEPIRLRLRATRPSRVLRRQSPSQLAGRAAIDAGELLRLDEPEALDRGTVLHTWFERVAWSDEFDESDEALLELGRRLGSGLSEPGLLALLAEFRGYLADPIVSGALSRSRYEGDARAERELRFVTRRADTLLEGIIDRLVLVSRAGRLVEAEVIDFKTDRTGSDPARVSGVVDRYRPQLTAYREAVAELYGLPLERCRSTLVLLEARRVEPVLPADPSALEPWSTEDPSGPG